MEKARYRKEILMTISKELYQERKNKNLCTKCGKATQSDKTLCSHHRQKAKENAQAIVIKRKKGKLCYKCGQKLTNGRKSCNNCLNKNVPKQRDDRWISPMDREKLGLCVACSKPNKTSNKWCDKCSNKYNTIALLTRRSRIANGLCSICGERLLSNRSNIKCIICIHKNKKWYASSNYRQTCNQKQRLLRDTIIQHYGEKCVCCGVSEKTFLAIDHINDDGNIHRQKIKKRGRNFHEWIIDNNFPKDLQILCHNCNMSKHLNSGTCAHKLVTVGV